MKTDTVMNRYELGWRAGKSSILGNKCGDIYMIPEQTPFSNWENMQKYIVLLKCSKNNKKKTFNLLIGEKNKNKIKQEKK